MAERREDIEPNIDYLLRAFGAEHGQMVRFNREARDRHLRYALSPMSSASGPAHASLAQLLGSGAAAQFDGFDTVQLQAVIDVCRRSASLPDAGHTLFAVSRQAKRQPNDVDRLKKYPARFGLSWEAIWHFDAS